MNASELYSAGRLREAVAAMNDEVRKHPTDLARRAFLCELLCAAGNVDRADKQLEAIVRQSVDDSPGALAGIALMRQLVRAEEWRRQLFLEGRPPELLGRADEATALYLRATVAQREGKEAEVAQLLAQAEELRPRVRGTVNGAPVDDVRDLDDRLGGTLEVLTSTGKYYWIPLASVQSLEMHPPQSPRDLIWRRATMQVREGPDGDVYLPAIYGPVDGEEDDALLLGRRTEWSGGEGEPVRGFGLRTFLAGDEALTILELETMQLEPAPAASA